MNAFRRRTLAAIAMLAAGSISAFGIAELRAEGAQIERTELMNVPLGVAEGVDGVMVLSVLPPGGVAPKHHHPADEFSYVLEGAIILTVDGAEPVTYAAGESYHIDPGIPHSATNASETEPTRILVFWTAEAGKPLTEMDE
ncbi:MAG: dimethylsulfonioproprionate lyase family protein [Dongiaceae bacterium]